MRRLEGEKKRKRKTLLVTCFKPYSSAHSLLTASGVIREQLQLTADPPPRQEPARERERINKQLND